MNSTPEHDLTDTLTREATRFAEAHGTGLSVDSVIARAGEIRRGRRLRASLVMAAVLAAVAIPAGIVIAGEGGPAKPVQPLSHGDHSALTLGPLTTGPEPKTGYAHAGVLYPAKFPLGSGGTPTLLARIDGGYLVARKVAGTEQSRVHFIGDDGTRLAVAWPIQGGFAVSPQGNVGVFAEPDGTVMAVQDAGSRYFAIGRIPGVDQNVALTAVAVAGENCSGRSEADTCDIYVNDVGVSQSTWVLSPHATPHPDQSFRRTTALSSTGDKAGFVDTNGGCSAVENRRSSVQWETCDHWLTSFSPSGARLLAAPANSDGLGDAAMSVLDARTGDATLTLDAGRHATIMSTQWEDDTHVLVDLFAGGRWAVLRIGLDGSRQYALPPVPGDDAAFPYLLATTD